MTPKPSASTPQIRRCPDFGDYLLFWPISVFGVALDLWSKNAVFAWLQSVPSQEYSLIDGFLQFILRENTGAAFSLFAGMKWLFIAISFLAMLVLVVLFFWGKLTPRLTLAALACMNAGILGNLYDRLFNEGRVRDFIDVYVGDYHWPTFNVADSLLCIGVGILLIAGFTGTTGQKPAATRTGAS
jgi:signal peptidase II